jgi:hypothetical protein
MGCVDRLLRGTVSKSADKSPMHVSAAARLQRTDIGNFLHQAWQSSQGAFFKVFSSFENHGAPYFLETASASAECEIPVIFI